MASLLKRGSDVTLPKVSTEDILPAEKSLGDSNKGTWDSPMPAFLHSERRVNLEWVTSTLNWISHTHFLL